MSRPRLRRLQLDSERLDSRLKNWPLIQITRRLGTPPEVYHVTYNIKGLYAAPDGSILEREQHVMEVNLSLAYPRRAPQCKMLTPVFHPNFDDSSVCIGDFWAASEGLDDLIIRIGRMIAYQEYNTKSPLNGLAAKWAAEHEKMLPVCAREIAPPAPPQEPEPAEKLVVKVTNVSNLARSVQPAQSGNSIVGNLLSTTPKRQPVLVDCVSGDNVVVQTFPYHVGAGTGGAAGSGGLFSLQSRNGKCWLCPWPGRGLVYDGGALDSELEIATGEDHTLSAGDRFFLLRMTSQPADWLNHIDPQQWFIHQVGAGVTEGPHWWFELADKLRQIGRDLDGIVVHCSGMRMGFFASQLALAQPAPAQPPVSEPASPSPPAEEPALLSPPPHMPHIDAKRGEFTCPVCWLKFNRGAVMSIAVHASLRGDPMLGQSAMQRFFATRFNDQGQALDAMDLDAPDLACPHCRRKLPPGFLGTPHYIFSIVGAPSSGKSYYLSVLVKQLQHVLFKTFKVIFRDADPSENVILTAMKTSLFSAGTPEEAHIAKTDLEGALYENLPRHGRKVRLPKPFIFRLSAADDPGREASLVFYDNAGEHFEPTRNSADSPGAQHIAVASGIFFLFDPLHNAEFRARLKGIADPQLATPRMDQQDVILAETEVRIKGLLGLESKDRVKTPLAFMVGKCDTWLHMLGAEPLLPALAGGRVHLANIKANSARLRDFLMEIAPAVVANADAISSNIMYFAISPLGASPVEFIDGNDGSTRIGPDPKLLNPQFVEIPTLWVLSQVTNHLIPSEGD